MIIVLKAMTISILIVLAYFPVNFVMDKYLDKKAKP
jgi:hypothetical protein